MANYFSEKEHKAYLAHTLKLSAKTKSNLIKVLTVVSKHNNPIPSPNALYNFHSLTFNRIEDFIHIVRRLYRDRALMKKNDLQKMKYLTNSVNWSAAEERERKRLFEIDSELTTAGNVGIESIYIFGSILLDFWSVFVAHALGVPDPSKHHFFKLHQTMQDKKSPKGIQKIWKKYRHEVLWLTSQIRYYRNHFLMHPSVPLQKGSNRALYGYDLRLWIPVSHGWHDEVEMEKMIRNFSRQISKSFPELSREEWDALQPRKILEIAAQSIGKLRKQKDIDRLNELIGLTGLATPSFQDVAIKILDFLQKATLVVSKETAKAPGLIDLGQPKRLQQKTNKVLPT